MGILSAFLAAIVQGLIAWFKPDPAEKAGRAEERVQELEADDALDAKAMAARDASSGAAVGKLRDGSPDPDCRDCGPGVS